MKMLNLGKPSEVPKLNEAMAIELGAELLGETIIFGFAALTLVAEYVRQSRKESSKEAEQESRLKGFEHSLANLQQTIEQQNITIDELTRQYNEVKQKSIIGKLIEEGKRQITGTPNLENSSPADNTINPENQGLINYAICDVTNHFGLKQMKKSDHEVTYVGELCSKCQVCSRLGIDYPLSEEIPLKEPYYKQEYTKHGFLHEALTDSLLSIGSNMKETSKSTLKLAKPCPQYTVCTELKYMKQPQSLFHQSIISACDCVIGKKDTNKFEFDSQFLTALDFAEETDSSMLYDFNLAEVADDASSIFMGDSSILFPTSTGTFSSRTEHGITKHSDHKIVQTTPGMFEQAICDAVDCIVE